MNAFSRCFCLALVVAQGGLLAQSLDGVVTPEPATAGLVIAGLAGFGLVLWRRNRNRE